MLGVRWLYRFEQGEIPPPGPHLLYRIDPPEVKIVITPGHQQGS